MKRFYKFLVIALAGVVTLGVYSCDNVNMYDQMVTPSTIDLEYTFETPTPVRIAVTAGHDWYVQSTADWITVSTITNTGFTLNLDQYVGEGPDVRSGVVLVSSQIGQWPVVVNQERTPFSAVSDYLGTYRVTANLVAFDTDDDGETYYPVYSTVDYLDELVLDPEMTENDMYFSNWADVSGLYCDLQFDAATSTAKMMPYGYDYTGTGYYACYLEACVLDLVNGGVADVWNDYGYEFFTITQDKESFTLPATFEGETVYYGVNAYFFGIIFDGYFKGYMSDVKFTKIEAAPAPSQGAPSFSKSDIMKFNGIDKAEAAGDVKTKDIR